MIDLELGRDHDQDHLHPGAWLPVEVVLHVLGQVYVEENEVVHVAPGERDPQTLGGQLAAPFLNAQDCIVDDFWCCFNVL